MIPVPDVETISASQFKARCLDIMDRLADGRLDKLVVTKRGKPVATIMPPEKRQTAVDSLYGCMEGLASVPGDIDLTAPLDIELSDAERGILHR